MFGSMEMLVRDFQITGMHKKKRTFMQVKGTDCETTHSDVKVRNKHYFGLLIDSMKI